MRRYKSSSTSALTAVVEARDTRILVTGGAGFVGSHLVDRLLSSGNQVICLDDFSTGRSANVSHLLNNPNFELVRADVVSPFQIDVDQIYNLASPASPPHYQLDPIRTFRTNVLGAMNVLDLAEATGARTLLASTSEVYGDPEVHPQPEGYWGHVNSFGPRSCYDEGKRSAETLYHDYHDRRGVDIRVARIFNTYGPRMRPDDGRVVSNFIVQALKGEDITIYGDGSQTRSFCYVDDLVDGLVALMNAPALHTPVNLGNTGEFTMIELAEAVLSITGSASRLVYRPLPVDDPRQRRPDTTKAKQELGWSARVPLAEGLTKTISYFDSLLRVQTEQVS
jgi:UDP-glucuronate decarboxylase